MAKMTLKGYYNSLPRSISPRKKLIREIAERCEVSEQTARNWCLYGIKPKSYVHVKHLIDITGIKEENLW